MTSDWLSVNRVSIARMLERGNDKAHNLKGNLCQTDAMVYSYWQKNIVTYILVCMTSLIGHDVFHTIQHPKLVKNCFYGFPVLMKRVVYGHLGTVSLFKK